MDPGLRPRLARALPELALCALYLGLALGQSRIHDRWSTHCYGGGYGDPGHDGWVLSRVTAQLLREPWRPFEGNIYSPSPSSVLYWDPLLGPALLVLPLRALGANPVLLYNAAIVLSLALASWASDRLARRLGVPPLAAVLAGVAVPYTGQQLERLLHLNLLAIPFFPLLLLGLLELLARPRPWAALGTGLAFALQAATSGYHAFGAALLVLLTLAWGWRRLRDPRVWLWGAAAALVAGLLLEPYWSGFAWLRAHEARMAREPQVARALSLDLGDLFASHSYAWRGLLSGANPFFPGLAVLLLAAWALRDLRRDAHVRLLALIAAGSFLMALGPQVRAWGRVLGPGPFALFSGLPFLDAMRHPYTLAVPGLLALGLLSALGLARSRLGRSPALAALVVALAVGESVRDVPARLPAPVELPPVYSELARLEAAERGRGAPPGAVLELPFRDRAYTWRAGFHDLRLVNGVGAFEPAHYQGLVQLLRREWKGPPQDMHESRSLEYLKTWFSVRWVVVHEPDETWRQRLETTPRSFVLVHESPEARVYRLRGAGRAPVLFRGLRDDELRLGRIQARLGAMPPGRVEALLDGRPLGPVLELGEAPRALEWLVPPGTVGRGLNLFELRRSDSGPGVLELEDLDAR